MRRRPGSAWLWAATALLAGTALSSLWLAVQAERKLATLVLGGLGVSFSTRIWAAPFPVKDGGRGEAERLVSRLDRLGYRRTRYSPVKGEYRWTPPELVVSLRGHRIPGSEQSEGVFILRRNDTGAWNITEPFSSRSELPPSRRDDER